MFIFLCVGSVQRLGEDDCKGCVMVEEKDHDDCILVKVELSMQL